MPRKTILVIDDEKKLCQMVKRRLEHEGQYDVIVAYCGQEGIAQAQAAAVDLVVTDVHMPGMDGHAVVEALKRLRPELPVVLLSVYHDDSKIVTPELIRKADAVVGKPISRQQLCRTIEEVLARRGGRS